MLGTVYSEARVDAMAAIELENRLLTWQLERLRKNLA